MSEKNRTPTIQFGQVGDVHHSGESASDGEENLRSQLLDRRMSSSEVDWRMSAIVTPISRQLEMPISRQLEMLIQSGRELRERSSARRTEGNETSERSRSSGQRSDKYIFAFYMFFAANLPLFADFKEIELLQKSCLFFCKQHYVREHLRRSASQSLSMANLL